MFVGWLVFVCFCLFVLCLFFEEVTLYISAGQGLWSRRRHSQRCGVVCGERWGRGAWQTLSECGARVREGRNARAGFPKGAEEPVPLVIGGRCAVSQHEPEQTPQEHLPSLLPPPGARAAAPGRSGWGHSTAGDTARGGTQHGGDTARCGPHAELGAGGHAASGKAPGECRSTTTGCERCSPCNGTV